jgi:hypothetical protein
MHRASALLLCAYLLAWVPAGLAGEVFSTIPSLSMRGAPAIVELGLHGAVAMTSATAGYMLLISAPAAVTMARAAIAANALISIQSLYWTVLPRNIAPGDSLPLLALAGVSAAFWLLLLGMAGRRPSA